MMYNLPVVLRRSPVIILLIALCGLAFFLFPQLHLLPFSPHGSRPPSSYHSKEADKRVHRLERYCKSASDGQGGELDEFERLYGRTNLRLSRAYEGSHERLRRFLKTTLRGEKVTVSVIGGSGESRCPSAYRG